jgi:uncharacterized protein YcfL
MRTLFVVLALALLPACSDDTKAPTPDKGPVAEASVKKEAGPVVEASVTKEAGPAVEASVAKDSKPTQ